MKWTILPVAILFFPLFASADELQTLAIRTAEKLGGTAKVQSDLDELAPVFVRLPSATDADIRQLVKIPAIGGLEVLDASKLTDLACVSLKELPDLQVLRLLKCPMTEKHTAALGSIRTLNELFLGDAKLNDLSFSQMKKLVNIKRLDLSNCNLTDKSVPMLLTMKKLESLNLAGTKISDAGVVQLKDLTALRLLYLNNSNATQRGISALEAARGKDLTIRY